MYYSFFLFFLVTKYFISTDFYSKQEYPIEQHTFLYYKHVVSNYYVRNVSTQRIFYLCYENKIIKVYENLMFLNSTPTPGSVKRLLIVFSNPWQAYSNTRETKQRGFLTFVLKRTVGGFFLSSGRIEFGELHFCWLFSFWCQWNWILTFYYHSWM